MAKQQRISKSDRPIIKKLLRTNVEQTLAKLSPFINQSRWLAKTNRYSVNTITRLKGDVKKSLKGKQLAQYISASSVLHCADGWSYLGRAINCLLKGDPHRVVHLAYYAELRAALCLLACEGVGVFHDLHFVIDAPNSSRVLPSHPSTHMAAWSYLKYWSTLKRSAALFSDVIAPAGIPLSDWFDSQGGVDRFVRPQARVWFSQWSMDLGLFSADRDARNESSYRPDGIPEPWYLSASESLSLATELWQACEPSPNASFDGIDRQILRITIENIFRGTTGRAATDDPAGFGTFAGAIVDSLPFESAIADEWKAFLIRNTAPANLRIFEYASKDPSDRSIGHAAVLSRATLLLRLATGSTLKLVRSAGISSDKLQFWWGQLGISRGLWDGTKDRTDLLDLWEDILVLFQDIEAFQAATPAAQQTFQLIGSQMPQVVTGLGGCERVAIWSLAP